MMKSTRGIVVLLPCLAGGCPGEVTGDECNDPKYGDGVCDVETSCGQPDIDCFTLFTTQAEAQSWYEANGPADRPAAPASDPRFTRMNELLLEGWAGYQDSHLVGDLTYSVPQLVLIDLDDRNAFVMSDATDHAGFAVMVNVGLIDAGKSDDEVLGVVMHELEHAVGLHVVGDVKQRTLRYYLAEDGEPFGFEQADDPVVRDHVERWEFIADDVGHLVDVELSGLPISIPGLPAGGVAGDTFMRAVDIQSAENPAGCSSSKAQLLSLYTSLADYTDIIDFSIALEGTDATTVILDVLSALQQECFAGVPHDALGIIAALNGTTPEALAEQMPPDLIAMVDGQPFVQGIFNWVHYERAQMRDIEEDFVAATGVAWDRARYFSTEEAADDSSVRTLRAMGRAPDGMGRFVSDIQPGLEAVCRPLVDAGTPIPYGENLADAHHGSCWRASHIDALADREASARVSPMNPLGPAPRLTPRFPRPTVRTSH
jgi:hypothetical protein